MSSVNFYLKKAEPISGKSLIYLQYKYNGKKLVFAFGQTINPKDWSDKKQRVKSNLQTTADGKHGLNDLLDNLEKVCKTSYNLEIKNGIPEPATLKKYLIDFMNQNKEDESAPTLFKLIERFTNNEIKYKGRSKSASTIKTYKTVQGHLEEFQQQHRTKLDFDNINLDFYYKYVHFLEEKGLNTSSIGKDIQILKVFMGEAFDLGYSNNVQFKHKKFAVVREDTDAVYLSDNQLIHLFNFDLSFDNSLERVRDLFVFGCFVGLRFSDYSDIKPEYIITFEGDLFIKMITQKTDELVIIPCNPIVLQIFNKYETNPNKLPQIPGNTTDSQNAIFNKTIKEVCKKVGFTETGCLATDPTKQLWECISSHTARRSFATNLHLQGYPTLEIMKITGHKTEKAFMKYIRTTKMDAAKRLQKHMQQKALQWNEKISKVVLT